MQKIKLHGPWVAICLAVALAVSSLGSGGCGAAMVEYPEPECAIEKSDLVGGNYAHKCACEPGGVEFVYRKVHDANGDLIGYDTYRKCNGKVLPGVMRSQKFPAWTGPPQPDGGTGGGTDGTEDPPTADEEVPPTPGDPNPEAPDAGVAPEVEDNDTSPGEV